MSGSGSRRTSRTRGETISQLGCREALSTLSGVNNQDSTRTESEYDAMAVEYDRHNASSAVNNYYERPATIELLGDVMDKRVLEVGCGTWPVTEWLVEHGAQVVACDVSTAIA
jgi:ubiquinone/menaquinone biosynthesis C-methylase UbiE